MDIALDTLLCCFARAKSVSGINYNVNKYSSLIATHGSGTTKNRSEPGTSAKANSSGKDGSLTSGPSIVLPTSH